MEVSPCDTDFDLFDDIFKGGLSSHSPDSGHDSPQSGFGAYQVYIIFVEVSVSLA